MRKPIIAIDPGLGGGIAVWRKDHATVVNMPDSVFKMAQYINDVRETYKDVSEPIVFIERLQLWGKEDDAPGKKFRIQQMLDNYSELRTVIKLSGMKYVEVSAISWQTTLRLKQKPDTRTDTQRKNDYKTFAANCFPECNVTLKTSDALCILQFAFYKIENDLDWVMQRVQNGVIQDKTKFFF